MMEGTFPHDECEALALAYVLAQDLSNYTPEQILALYDKAHETMCAVRKNQAAEKELWI